MPSYRLTRKADSDLKAVYFYSFEKFGKAQAEAYAAGLRIFFNCLQNNLELGKSGLARKKSSGSSSIAITLSAIGSSTRTS